QAETEGISSSESQRFPPLHCLHHSWRHDLDSSDCTWASASRVLDGKDLTVEDGGANRREHLENVEPRGSQPAPALGFGFSSSFEIVEAQLFGSFGVKANIQLTVISLLCFIECRTWKGCCSGPRCS